MSNYHSPVLLKESIDALDILDDGIYVDCTFGGGGHSKVILDSLGSNGKLYAFDCDADAHENAIDDPRFTLISANFRHVKRFLKLNGMKQVNGVLADLGVSSHQFNKDIRGFSYRFDAELDMRMNQSATKDAKQVLNTYSESDLADIFYYYGDIRASRKLARTVVNNRPLNSTFDFKGIVQTISADEKLLSQAFQAVRIEVNEEMEALKEMIQSCSEILVEGGNLVVISYHSIEDRIVKNYFKTGTFNGRPEKDLYGNYELFFKQINKKVIVPTNEEIKINKRARSAKLRIGQKL